MTDFLYTDARWTEHFVEVSDPHKEGHHVRFYFERTWVGLTDEELERIKLLTFEKEINADGEEQEAVNLDQLIRAAEQLCKEKNYE